MDMASNQPDNLALTAEQLREYSAAFNADRANLVAANAAVSNGILQAATSYRGVRELPRTFSVELKQGSITSQEHSGRCWMFASLNTLRYELMHKWNLDDFEFSESYLFFYDKLEKSNFYLENVLKTLDKTTDSRIFEAVNEGPADDGGWWQMFVALVKKYGLVPKEAYPESSNSRDSSAFEQYLNTKLREFAAELRDAHQAGKSVEELRSLKTGQMSVVYRICAIAMGEPPTSFDLLLRVKDEGKDDAKDDAKASESGTKSGIDSRRQIVEHGITPQEFYDLAIENNLYRCSLPEEYGGWGLNELEILQVQEEFSRGPGGMRMHLHYAMDLNWRILDDYGSPELKAEYMSKFQNKEVFTCFALTEATGGTGADLHTMAVKDGDSYVLNGEKTLISHTDCCEFAYVIAVTNPDSDKDDRLSAFFVPMDAPGFEVINMPHMMGCRGAGHGDLKFTNCRIDKKYLLGREGQGLEIAMHSLSVSRAHIAASNLGMAQRMLELSLAYAHDRVTFGKPIGTRQAIRVKIADMSMMVHALRCMVYDFAKAYMENPTGEYIEEKAAMCKLFSI